MHRSRLFSITIDCDNLDKGVQFWSQALGVGVKDSTQSAPFVGLEQQVPGVEIWLQPVPEAKECKSRAHLDLETDDLEAEVARLEALGAVRHQKVESWWIMRDPCGNEFCVLPVMSRTFPENTRTWGEKVGA